ncbi:MAG: BON domain-containing protein [Oscillatoriales cyanobacterium RM1_1_9]|nr:BON domain-containing protein [Oscillatoriales cyanobacterium RM2_1_1]NJO70813.1 BON domain-containing protein [Oscillatoriales cyanobacterium RM1_1_9]
MKSLTPILLGVVALTGAVACDVARTSADAPRSTAGEVTVEDAQTVEATQDDADNPIRQAQLDSDIRAREQRNDIVGDQAERADADIESEVRAKLEANIPRSKLTIDANEGLVDIVGTVPNQEEYDTIEPLAKEILGVKQVKLDVKIVEPGMNESGDTNNLDIEAGQEPENMNPAQ